MLSDGLPSPHKMGAVTLSNRSERGAMAADVASAADNVGVLGHVDEAPRLRFRCNNLRLLMWALQRLLGDVKYHEVVKPWVNVPGEADVQAAWLARLLGATVFTEDSDLLAIFLSPRVISKLEMGADLSLSGTEVYGADVAYALGVPERFAMTLAAQILVAAACALVGTDAFPGGKKGLGMGAVMEASNRVAQKIFAADASPADVDANIAADDIIALVLTEVGFTEYGSHARGGLNKEHAEKIIWGVLESYLAAPIVAPTPVGVAPKVQAAFLEIAGAHVGNFATAEWLATRGKLSGWLSGELDYEGGAQLPIPASAQRALIEAAAATLSHGNAAAEALRAASRVALGDDTLGEALPAVDAQADLQLSNTFCCVLEILAARRARDEYVPWALRSAEAPAVSDYIRELSDVWRVGLFRN